MASLRELNSARELRELREKDEREARELEMAPVREAEEENRRLLRELRTIEREAVIAGKADPGFMIPESVAGKSMGGDDAEQFNAREATKFRENNPEFEPYKSRANIKTIISYLLQQGINIADEATFKVAFERLRDLGLLTARPEPELEQPSLEPEPVADTPIIAPAQTEQPQTRLGLALAMFKSRAERGLA
jgi:hypothetical protein